MDQKSKWSPVSLAASRSSSTRPIRLFLVSKFGSYSHRRPELSRNDRAQKPARDGGTRGFDVPSGGLRRGATLFSSSSTHATRIQGNASQLEAGPAVRPGSPQQVVGDLSGSTTE